MKTTIAIVEDNPGICEELKHVLDETIDLACISVSRNLQTALLQVPLLVPDVVIMDINLPDGSGITGAGRLKQLLPGTQIVMHTIYDDSNQIFRALEVGASGYLLKSAEPAELIRAIREVRLGGGPMSGEVARKVIQSFRKVQPARAATVDGLTKREEEVLNLLAKGFSSSDIARQLDIALETVNSHLKHIYGKMHVRTRTQAVIKYME
jgi:DNA-binding NarL/FixJ family response regulator